MSILCKIGILAFQLDLKLHKFGVFIKLIDFLLDDYWLSPVLRVISRLSESLRIVDRPVELVYNNLFSNDFTGLFIYVSESLFETIDIIVVENVLYFVILILIF